MRSADTGWASAVGVGRLEDFFDRHAKELTRGPRYTSCGNGVPTTFPMSHSSIDGTILLVLHGPRGQAMSLSPVVRQVLAGLSADDLARQPDTELLARFVASRDEAAFAVLVERHG